MNSPGPSNTSVNRRSDSIDVLRGGAIAMMFIYHFCYDLSYYKLVNFDFYQTLGWVYFRVVIVSSFLFLVGVSLYLASRHGIKRPRFLRRMAWLLGYASIVSLSSYLIFAERWIFFGILHFIALASVVGLLFCRFFWLNLWLGIAIIILGLTFSHPVFDQPMLQWLGMVTRLPGTEDYVQFVPWFGVVLLGMFTGKLVFERRPQAFIQWRSRHVLSQLLALGGRHSLHIYMLHQPLFLAMLYPVSLISGQD